MRPQSDPVSWKRIIHNSTFITWLAVQNKLATKDRMLSWNMNIDGVVVCVRGVTKIFLTYSLSAVTQ